MTGDSGQLRGLFAALQDGTISVEEHARLEEALAQSEEARRLWFLHCDIETGLTNWAATRAVKAAAFTPPRQPSAVEPRAIHR